MIFAACNANKKTAEAPVLSAKIEENKEEKVFFLKRGACFGTCPIFKLTIYSTGKAIYEGENHVEKLGQFEKNIGEEKLKALIKAFNAANFFEFEDEYTSDITDFPTTYIEFTQDGKSKKIKDYYGAPESLKALEKKLDAIANSEGWEKVADLDH